MTVRSLSVVIPAYDEERAIAQAVRDALAGTAGSVPSIEVVVVDDGSRDRTAEIVCALAAEDPRVRLVRHARNAGKGRALRTGFAEARHDWVLFLDADGQVRSAPLRGVVEAGPRCDAVLGYRIGRRDTLGRRLVTVTFRLAVGALLGVRVRDVNCPFKLLRRELVRSLPLRSDGFMIDAEILHRLTRLGVDTDEVAVAWQPRAHGRSTVRLRHLPQLLRELWVVLRDRTPAVETTTTRFRREPARDRPARGADGARAGKVPPA